LAQFLLGLRDRRGDHGIDSREVVPRYDTSAKSLEQDAELAFDGDRVVVKNNHPARDPPHRKELPEELVVVD
jgi:hypothetical protein